MNHNFTLVEPFVKRSYEFIESKKESGDNQLYYHIYVIYFLANINFRNHRFTESQSYLTHMSTLMQKQGSRYHSRFYLRQQLLTALNLHFSGKPAEALAIAEKALKSATKKSAPEDVNDLRVCIAMFMVQQRTAVPLNIWRSLPIPMPGTKRSWACYGAFAKPLWKY
jgi:ATP/maltotriose-dependent transcriptional regulator MalT